MSDFPALPVNIQSMEMPDLLFTSSDIMPQKDVQTQEQAKLEAKNNEFCDKLIWWDCTGAQTNDVCSYNTATSKCVANTLSAKGSYYDRWLQIYGAFYANMNKNTKSSTTPKPQQQPQKQPVTQFYTPPRRRHSLVSK